MNKHDPRPPALDAVASSTRASIRAALAASLVSPASHGAAELFRSARECAQREQIAPAVLADILRSSWAEVADSADIPTDERGDRLAAILTHAIAWVLEAENPKR